MHQSDGGLSSDYDVDNDDEDYDDYKEDMVAVSKKNDLNRKRSRSQPPTMFEEDLDDIDDDPVTPVDVGDFHPVLFDIASDSTDKWEYGKKKKKEKEQRHSSNYHGPTHSNKYMKQQTSVKNIHLHVDDYQKKHSKIITTPNVDVKQKELSSGSSIDYHEIIKQVGDVMSQSDNDDMDDEEVKQNMEMTEDKPKLQEMKTDDWVESVFHEIIADQDHD